MGVTSFFKNLFGSAKETTSELADKAELTLEHAKENAAPYIEKADAFVEDSIEKAKEAATPIIEKANDYANQTKEAVSEYAEEAGDMLGNIVNTVKESTTEAVKKAETFIKESTKSHSDIPEIESSLNNESPSKEFRNRIEEDAD